MKHTDIVAGILALLVVFGLGYVVFLTPVSDGLGYRQVEIPGSELAVTAHASLVFADADVTMVQSGFITVHESMGSAPGAILGVSRYVEPGRYQDLSIAVDPPLAPGLSYVALLHVDDGDKAYEEQEDMPVTSNGEVVRADFTVAAAE